MEYILKTFKKTPKKSTLQKRFNIFFGVMMLFGLLFFIIAHKMGRLIIVFAVLWAILVLIIFVLQISASVRKEPLLGRFDGEILFKKDLINIKGQEISLDEISKLEIYNDDYKGKTRSKGRYNVEGCISQGVSNTLMIKDKNNKETKIHFLLERKNQLREMENLLIHYCQKGIIHRLHFLWIFWDLDMMKFKFTKRNMGYKFINFAKKELCHSVF